MLQDLSEEHNMLTERARHRLACKLATDPRQACADLKERVHDALVEGRDHLNNEDRIEASRSFAYAFQMRCVCDFVWTEILGKESNEAHDRYLQLSRYFGRYALGRKLPKRLEAEVRTAIENIHKF